MPLPFGGFPGPASEPSGGPPFLGFDPSLDRGLPLPSSPESGPPGALGRWALGPRGRTFGSAGRDDFVIRSARRPIFLAGRPAEGEHAQPGGGLQFFDRQNLRIGPLALRLEDRPGQVILQPVVLFAERIALGPLYVVDHLDPLGHGIPFRIGDVVVGLGGGVFELLGLLLRTENFRLRRRPDEQQQQQHPQAESSLLAVLQAEILIALTFNLSLGFMTVPPRRPGSSRPSHRHRPARPPAANRPRRRRHRPPAARRRRPRRRACAGHLPRSPIRRPKLPAPRRRRLGLGRLARGGRFALGRLGAGGSQLGLVGWIENVNDARQLDDHVVRILVALFVPRVAGSRPRLPVRLAEHRLVVGPVGRAAAKGEHVWIGRADAELPDFDR